MGTHDMGVEAVARELREVVDAATNPLRDRLDRIEVREHLAALDTPGDRRATTRGPFLTKAARMVDVLNRQGIDTTGAGDFSLGRTILAAVNPKSAAACSDIELKTLATAPGSTGGFAVPTAVAGQVWDYIRPMSRCLEAGISVYPMRSAQERMPRIDDPVTVGWKAEGAALAQSAPTFGAVTATARTVGALCKLSYELAEDSPAAAAAVEREIMSAVSQEIDRAILFGNGLDEPQGVFGMSGVTAINTDAAPADYSKFVALKAAVTGESFRPSAFLVSTGMEARMGGLFTGISSDKSFLPVPPFLADVPMLSTNQIPATGYGASGAASVVFCAAWENVVLCVRPELTIRVLSSSERYMDELAWGVAAYIRCDVVAIRPAAVAYDQLKES